MLQVKIEDNIVIATFDNGKNNSITEETVKILSDIVNKVNNDDSLKGIVFTGAGKTFSSGFDLSMFLGFKDLNEVTGFFEKAEQVYIDLFTCKKPVVSAINGAAVAGGLITALASDYRIAKNHPKIKMGMTEIKIGLGLSIVQSEIMRFGLGSDKKYRDVMYFGELMDINKAKELEIVDEIVEENELIPRAKHIVSLWHDTPGRPFIVLKSSLKKEAANRMRTRLKEENWKEPFICFFDPATRKALEMVKAMMG